MLRRLMMVGLVLAPTASRAQGVRVVESTPAADASISGPSTAYSVRFDRPVDHVHSVMLVKRDGKVVQTLQPRLQSAPDVLFARAPTLPPGAYTLHWQVRTMTDAAMIEGEIPFKTQ
ncbi:MAG: copper resistance protein CopC [Reyranella sp.]|jgi:methionine-rich copper-binding protein CopC|nr:copper resistance protein CopC [Reyranella sp.]MBL6652115.1 copper resistance protein CopC [Reyranella sp.]